MNSSSQKRVATAFKNRAVIKAYKQIILEIKQSLPHYPTEQFRTYIEKGNLDVRYPTSHDFYSPILYVSLGKYRGKYLMSFAKNFDAKSYLGFYLDTLMFRHIYEQTSCHIVKALIQDRLEEYCYTYGNLEAAQLQCSEGNPEYSTNTVAEFKREINVTGI